MLCGNPLVSFQVNNAQENLFDQIGIEEKNRLVVTPEFNELNTGVNSWLGSNAITDPCQRQAIDNSAKQQQFKQMSISPF